MAASHLHGWMLQLPVPSTSDSTLPYAGAHRTGPFPSPRQSPYPVRSGHVRIGQSVDRQQPKSPTIVHIQETRTTGSRHACQSCPLYSIHGQCRPLDSKMRIPSPRLLSFTPRPLPPPPRHNHTTTQPQPDSDSDSDSDNTSRITSFQPCHLTHHSSSPPLSSPLPGPAVPNHVVLRLHAFSFLPLVVLRPSSSSLQRPSHHSPSISLPSEFPGFVSEPADTVLVLDLRLPSLIPRSSDTRWSSRRDIGGWQGLPPPHTPPRQRWSCRHVGSR